MPATADDNMAASSKVTRFVDCGKKILCIGRNYKAHAEELGNAVPTEPVVFLKPTSSYVTEGSAIKIPRGYDELHHEVELGLVIGKRGSFIPQSSALQHVGGFCLALDMTNRSLQGALKKKGLPWTLAKGFDTACPVSDLIPVDKIPQAEKQGIWLKVNGELKQEGNTENMIFSLPFLISTLSETFTLEEGDVILTGTPEGVGPVRAGDVIQCGLTGVAEMSFKVE